jgi:hypothetical protein
VVNPTAFNNPNAPASGTGYGAAPTQGNLPGSISGVGAYTPDWGKLISSDPGLLDVQGLLAAGGASDMASRNAAIQNAYVQFGGNVGDLSQIAKQLGMTEADVQNALGPDAQRLAQENTSAGLSTQARLSQANQDAIQKIKAELNKRGLLNSGETGFELDRQNLGFRQAQSDATQKLLGYLQQYQQGYLSAQQGREGTLAQAYGDAANRQFGANQGSAGATATLDHVDPFGHAVYKGPDGSLYNADGSPYSAPTPGHADMPPGGVSTTPDTYTPGNAAGGLLTARRAG